MGVSSGLAVGSGVLLERDQQLAALERHFAAVTASMVGRFVFVGGEAGVGKTSLVRRFCAEQPARILSGACDALATPHPLGPFLDIATISGPLQDVIAGGAQPYEVAASLLDELRSSRPSILVLEDLHWADDATLDVVRLLARRLETVPVLAVGTYRDDQIDRTHRLRVLIGELATWPGVVRLSLCPLVGSRRGRARRAARRRRDRAVSQHRRQPVLRQRGARGGWQPPPADCPGCCARESGTAGSCLPDAWSKRSRSSRRERTSPCLEALEPRAMDSVEECLASGVLTSTHDRCGLPA